MTGRWSQVPACRLLFIKPIIMGKNITITIDDKTYPCRATMGAMMRFKDETGHEVSEIKEGALSEFCTFLWCCVKSASKKEGIEFDMDLMTFADNIDEDTLLAWMQVLNEDAKGVGEKKRKKG